ncbi:hypothetical protein BLA29_002826 [Euroglyphus maynei]|uniref:Uncharacterized protein n=1 Tax=Euroglyphus maynei TaxID=6958 RepID=A0A1Y3AMR2_EURMA|nr:hypothetical protein BLA29_002826 [Euroglyphus maynei]
MELKTNIRNSKRNIRNQKNIRTYVNVTISSSFIIIDFDRFIAFDRYCNNDDEFIDDGGGGGGGGAGGCGIFEDI